MSYKQKPLYDHIYDRWKEKDGDYAKVNSNREIITTYFRSDEIIDTDDKGQLVGQAIYNGSGSWYSRRMATGFQGSLVSKNTDWIRYGMEELRLKGVDELDIFAQEVKDHMSFAYQKSNFYDIQPQFTHDGLTTGSPVIFGEEDMELGATMWMPQHFKTVRLYYDRYNLFPEGCIVQDKTWTAKKIFDTFVGEDDAEHTKSKAKLSTEVNSALRQGQFDQTFMVYKATFKYDDPIWKANGFTKPVGNWKWLTAYFLELTSSDADKKNEPLNDNMGDFSRPFNTWNFDKKPWECSSRTPAWYALWDNLSLQQLDKNYGEDLQYQNRPAMMYLNTMEGNLDLNPEGMNPVDAKQYASPPVRIDKLGSIQFNKEWMEVKEEALRRWFYIDQFQMFSDLALQKNQPVSANQIVRMAGEKATMLSPAIETHSRYLEGIDARMMDIEVQAGRGPFNKLNMENIRDIIENALGEITKNISVRPVFIGALAQAQKAAQVINPIQNTLGVVQGLMEVAPELKHRYRWPQIANDVEEAFDFQQKNVVPEEEYLAAVKADEEAAAQQQQFENGMEVMKNSKNVQGPVDSESILAKAAG